MGTGCNQPLNTSRRSLPLAGTLPFYYPNWGAGCIYFWTLRCRIPISFFTKNLQQLSLIYHIFISCHIINTLYFLILFLFTPMLRLSVGVAYGSPLQIFYIFLYYFFYCIFIVLLLATVPMLRLSVGPSAPTVICFTPLNVLFPARSYSFLHIIFAVSPTPYHTYSTFPPYASPKVILR